MATITVTDKAEKYIESLIDNAEREKSLIADALTWVRTADAAKILGISENWLRVTKDRYPHIKNGETPMETLCS